MAKKAHGKQRGAQWAQRVTEESDALDLAAGTFSSGDPKQIAESLARAAKESPRRKGTAYQSAMSMLTFYKNRAGAQLSEADAQILEEAKHELRKRFGRA